MKSKKRELNAEEVALWARVARSIAPMPGARMPVALDPPPQIHHKRTPPARTSPLPNAPRAEVPKGPGTLADRGAEKRVRRGQLEVDASLDLHGFTQERARVSLRAFLLRSQGEGARVVIVVTGKGGRLRDGEVAPGVLKRRLPDWLAAADLRPLVAGYAGAHARHGGAGAFYVFLRRAGSP